MAITNKTESTTGPNGVINVLPTNGAGNIQATNFHTYIGDLINWIFPGVSTDKGAVLTTSNTNYSLEWNVLVPIGSMINYPYKYVSGSISLPDGWLLCNGDSVLIASYPELYDLIGDDYNTGSPVVGAFTLPDNDGDQTPLLRGGVVATIIKY